MHFQKKIHLSGGLVLMGKIVFYLLVILILIPFELSAQVESRLEVIKVERRLDELLNRNNQENYDANGKLGALLIIQSDLSDLSFTSSNGILRVEQTKNRWKLLVSENERLITVFSDGSFPSEIILTEEGIELTSNYAWLIEIARVSTVSSSTGSGNYQLNTVPEGATLMVEGMGEYTSPFLFENRLAITWQVNISKPDYESLNFPMNILSGQNQEQTIELIPKFGHVNFNVMDQIDNQIDSPDFSITSEIQLVEPHIKAGYETIPVGKNQVLVSAPGFRSNLIEVIVEPYDEKVIDVKLDSTFAYFSFDVVGTTGRSISGTNVLIEDQYRIPELEQNNGIYALKEGNVIVNASLNGYQDRTYTFSVEAGKNETKELILLTNQEAELIPSDVKLTSDNNAFINAFGRSSRDSLIVNDVIPGSYLIEINHPYKSVSQEIFVRPDIQQNFYFPVLPSRSLTIASGIVPGLGHITTKRPRGWAYLGLTIATYAFSYFKYSDYINTQNQLSDAVNEYQINTDESLFNDYRRRISQLQSKRNDSYDLFRASLFLGISIQVGSITDLSISIPDFGYR